MGNDQPKDNTAGQTNQKIILRLRNRDIILHYAFKMKLVISDIGIFPHGLEGLKLWDSDVILSRFCILESQRFRAKDMLCLKAGVGISGIVLRKWTHCKNISMCDLRPQVMSNMQNNCEKNGVRQVTTFKLNWEEIAKTSLQYDTVITSDILKSELPPIHIIDFFKKVVRENGEAILVMPERKEEAKSFLSLVDKTEFKITNLLLTAEEYELSPLLNKVEGKSQFLEIGKCNFYAIILTKLPKKRLQKIENKNESSVSGQKMSNSSKQIKAQEVINKQIEKQKQQKLPNVELVINDKKQVQTETQSAVQEVINSQKEQLQNNQDIKIESEAIQIQQNGNQIKNSQQQQQQQHCQQIESKVESAIQDEVKVQKGQQNDKCCKQIEKQEKSDELNQIQQTKQQQI